MVVPSQSVPHSMTSMRRMRRRRRRRRERTGKRRRGG
jgi:hypothetical protein